MTSSTNDHAGNAPMDLASVAEKSIDTTEESSNNAIPTVLLEEMVITTTTTTITTTTTAILAGKQGGGGSGSEEGLSITSLSSSSAGLDASFANCPRLADAPVSTTSTGYVHTLTAPQKMHLFTFWAMFLEYLAHPESLAFLPPESAASASEKAPAASSASSSEHTSWSTGSTANSQSSNSSAIKKSIRSIGQGIHNACISAAGPKVFPTLSGEKKFKLYTGHPLAVELWCQLSTDDPDSLMLRFLRARKWILLDAFCMLIECLQWRRTFGVRKIMESGEGGIKPDSLLRLGKAYFWNIDKENRVVIIITTRLHDKSAQTLTQTMIYTVFVIESCRRLMLPGTETVTVVFDLTDAPLASLDFSGIQFLINTLQAYYPESLGKCLVLNAPWIFNGFWKMIKPLLDPVVSAKVEFLKTPELSNFIDPARLPRHLGGTDPFVYSYVEPTEADQPGSLLSHEERAERRAQAENSICKLVDTTMQLYQEFNKVSGSASPQKQSDGTADKEAAAIEKSATAMERAEIKSRICAYYHRMDREGLPRSLYDRIGVIQADGKVCWDVDREKYAVAHGGAVLSSTISSTSSSRLSRTFARAFCRKSKDLS